MRLFFEGLEWLTVVFLVSFITIVSGLPRSTVKG